MDDWSESQGGHLDVEVFHQADFSGVDFRDAILERTSFLDSDLTGADLRGANLVGAELGGAKLEDALMQGADLTFATLGDALLGSALLMQADLSGANLWGVDLCGADMTHVRLGRTVFAETLTPFGQGTSVLLRSCSYELVGRQRDREGFRQRAEVDKNAQTEDACFDTAESGWPPVQLAGQ